MNQVERMIYDVSQVARVAWFRGHYQLARRQVEETGEPASIEGPLPTRQELTRDLFRLFQRDRANIAAGRYRPPQDVVANPLEAIRISRRFLADVAEVNRRRLAGSHQEVFEAHGPDEQKYPRYYLQNFHFQTDGWLSEDSADLYDFQVEVLFSGGADAMRRQALIPLGDYLHGKRLADQPLLDVACGTGRFLGAIKQNFPRLPVTGLDLSRPYLDKAEAHLKGRSWTRLVEGAAEELPFADESFALVTSVYLFHELPRKIRRQAAAEMARVLRKGGRVVIVDSFQKGDRPEMDGLLDLFPRAYHEPYFADYARHDLRELFAEAGLHPVSTDVAFMSKVAVFEKR